MLEYTRTCCFVVRATPSRRSIHWASTNGISPRLTDADSRRPSSVEMPVRDLLMVVLWWYVVSTRGKWGGAPNNNKPLLVRIRTQATE